MQVSRAYIDQYASFMDKVNEAAGREVITQLDKQRIAERLMELPDVTLPDVARIMNEICGKYAKLASALTCQFYDGIRSASGLPDTFNATLWEGYDESTIRAAAWSIAEERLDGRATKPLHNLLVDLAYRSNKNAADGTIRQNTRRDPSKPRYAIVPRGDACAFCQMRASLGYTYADKDATHSHDRCTCVATPTFGGSTVQGYDPDRYLGRYNEAKDALRRGDISEDLAERIERERAEKGRDFDETNAILMVMREQQGIS